MDWPRSWAAVLPEGVRDETIVKKSGTVLLVDDEELVRTATSDTLTEQGYDVVEAGSAEEAIRLIDDGLSPDFLITDHLMPQMAGTELIRKLHVERPDLPALVISGYADLEGIAPEIPRLIKPFKHIDLAAAIAGLDAVKSNEG